MAAIQGHETEVKEMTTEQVKRIDAEQRTAKRIEELRREAENLRDNWLRKCGWEHTSKTPGCFWMWRKDEFFCDAETAERIQRMQTANEYFKAHPERCGD